jgi:hypothetical protein
VQFTARADVGRAGPLHRPNSSRFRCRPRRSNINGCDRRAEGRLSLGPRWSRCGRSCPGWVSPRRCPSRAASMHSGSRRCYNQRGHACFERLDYRKLAVGRGMLKRDRGEGPCGGLQRGDTKAPAPEPFKPLILQGQTRENPQSFPGPISNSQNRGAEACDRRVGCRSRAQSGGDGHAQASYGGPKGAVALRRLQFSIEAGASQRRRSTRT